MTTKQKRPGPTRREVLKYGSATAVVLVVGCGSSDDPEPGGSPDAGPVGDGGSTVDCTVTPEYTEGPLYVNTGDVRRDITEGLPGAAMMVRLILVDAVTCQPLSGLAVDLWHASPEGLYSGVDNGILVPGAPDTAGETYMRGRQITDDAGQLSFETVYPGWYPIVPPHLHFTAPFGDGTAFTWQFFLDDAFSDQVYTTVAPYDTRGTHPVRTEGSPPDLILRPDGSPNAPIIDRVVGIDLSALGPVACEYDRPCP
ncbi:MAG: protocatechuate dioxygenase [Myxococcota bacterium]